MAPALNDLMLEGIDLPKVEAALAELRGGEAAGSVRATTLNLVVHAPDRAGVERTVEVLERIGGSRPLRAIVVTPGDGKPLATVSSSCWTGGGQQVCAERIVITGERAALPSAVVPLLVSDLPVFLWWLGEVAEQSRLMRELATTAGRLIVDSDDTGLDAIERLLLYTPSVADLAWRRLAPWREAVATLFDGKAQRRALDHLLGLEVRGPRNEALLLAGWLRSRLARQVGLDHAARTKRMNAVELHCGDEVFQVARMGRNQHGVATGPGLAEHVVRLPTAPLAVLVAEELDRLGAERTFEEALGAVA